MTTTDPTLAAIAASYAPYDKLAAFAEGLAAYEAGCYRNPYDGQPQHGVAAQAWDRGLECGCRHAREIEPAPRGRSGVEDMP